MNARNHIIMKWMEGQFLEKFHKSFSGSEMMVDL